MSDASSGRIQVIYLMGFRHSGTTILAALLGGIPGFRNLGEAHNLWGQKHRGWPRCGCTERVNTCPFWGRIVEEVALADPHADSDSGPIPLEDEREAWMRAWRRSVFQMGKSELDELADRYAQKMQEVYRLAASSGETVLVDSSKKPAFAALFERMPDIDGHLVHVTRDPRAGLWSQLRRAGAEAEGDPRYSTTRFSSSWLGLNALSERAARRHESGGSIRLRYEDFVADPRQSLIAISRMAGVTEPTLPLEGSHTALIEDGHSASGNARVRFRSGPIQLRLDDEWKEMLPAGQRRVVTAMTSPLLARYGYAVRAGST